MWIHVQVRTGLKTVFQPTEIFFVKTLRNPERTSVIPCGFHSCWWLSSSLPSYTGSSIFIADFKSSSVSFSILDTSDVHTIIILLVWMDTSRGN